jgi:hypothetical protein
VITLDPSLGVAGQRRSPAHPHRAVVLFPAMVELGVRDVIAKGGYPMRLVIA